MSYETEKELQTDRYLKQIESWMWVSKILLVSLVLSTLIGAPALAFGALVSGLTLMAVSIFSFIGALLSSLRALHLCNRAQAELNKEDK